MKAVCALVSGGVESVALLAHYLKRGKTVWPLYVRCGYFWEEAELHWLKRLLGALKRPRLRKLTILQVQAQEHHGPRHWSLTGKGAPGRLSRDERVGLPGRNILLLSKAAVFCAQKNIPAIALGSLGSNPFPDGRARFFRQFARAASTGLGRPVRILAPFAKRHKAEVVHRAGSLPWRFTFSCISPRRRRPCGRCNKCEEKSRVKFTHLP